MKNNMKQFMEDFLDKQDQIEQTVWEVVKLMDEMEQLENESLKKVFDNKAKFERLFNYSKTFNSYYYWNFDLLYKMLWNEEKLVKWLNEFSNYLQDFTFQLNIFTNTFVEDIINYEMAEKFLNKNDLELSANDISYKLSEIKTEDKLQFIREKLWKMTWMKNFKSTLMQVLWSYMPLKFSYYYFSTTNWKLKVLSDYREYIFYRQLYYRYDHYLAELWKVDSTENVDIISLNLSQKFLISKDLSALHVFISSMYILLHNYQINLLDSKTILRSFINSCWINYLPNWDIKVRWFDDLPDVFISNLKGICSILFKGRYPEQIENYKNKYNITEEEFEIFKNFRFISIFKEWNLFFDILKKIEKLWIFNKLKYDNYFDVLYSYWLQFTSVYWTAWNFEKIEIRKISLKIQRILNDKKNGLPLFFIDDLNHMKDNLDDFLKDN